MVHFLFYAGEAYNNKLAGDKQPVESAFQKGLLQENIFDTFGAIHSSFSYEDLPSDFFGAVFAVNHFNPNSQDSLGQQIIKYFIDQLDTSTPNKAPNYNSLPQKDSGKHSGIYNYSRTPYKFK